MQWAVVSSMSKQTMHRPLSPSLNREWHTKWSLLTAPGTQQYRCCHLQPIPFDYSRSNWEYLVSSGHVLNQVYSIKTDWNVTNLFFILQRGWDFEDINFNELFLLIRPAHAQHYRRFHTPRLQNPTALWWPNSQLNYWIALFPCTLSILSLSLSLSHTPTHWPYFLLSNRTIPLRWTKASRSKLTFRRGHSGSLDDALQ